MKPMRVYSYIGIQVFRGVIGLFIILTGLILLVDLIESLREVERYEDAGFFTAVMLTLMRTPKIALAIMPFIFLFGAIWAFAQMSRQSEIAVMRSAGISIWGIVTPPAIIAFITGILVIGLVDPIASNLSLKSHNLLNKYSGKSGNLLKPLQSGIWLRQKDGATSLILHAEGFEETTSTLRDATFWRRSLDGVFIERWDAPQTVIGDYRFILKEARRTTIAGKDRDTIKEQVLPSAFKIEDLLEDKSRPDTMSFWALPGYIKLSKEAGLPSVRYEMRYYEQLSLPLKLFAMILIAACVSLRSSRSGGTFNLILFGIGSGFLLFILSELANATAISRLTPVPLAAWAPGFLAIFIATTLLLYLEDG